MSKPVVESVKGLAGDWIDIRQGGYFVRMTVDEAKLLMVEMQNALESCAKE